MLTESTDKPQNNSTPPIYVRKTQRAFCDFSVSSSPENKTSAMLETKLYGYTIIKEFSHKPEYGSSVREEKLWHDF
jgi:hypothetical protein